MSCKYLDRNRLKKLSAPTPKATVTPILQLSPYKIEPRISLDDITSSVSSAFEAGKAECCNALKDLLSLKGFTEEMLGMINEVFDALSSLQTMLSDIMSAIESMVARVLDSISQGIRAAADALSKAMDAVKFASYELFNAKQSLEIKEPKPSEKGDAEPVDNQDSNYTLQEDYPNSYGFIDDGKNWTKVNKKTGLTEKMYHSMSIDKVDGKGNETVYRTGSAKRIVDKDTVNEIKGNYTLVVGKDLYIHVKGKVTWIVDKEYNKTVQKDVTENISGAVTENYAKTQSTTAGSSMTLKASVINLN